MTEAETAEFNVWLCDGYNPFERDVLITFDVEGTVARFREKWQLANDEANALIRLMMTMKVEK